MTSIDEKVNCIIEGTKEQFNSLPFEERKKICEYTSEMQILTLWQVINGDKDLTTSHWRKKQMKWLKVCVERHVKEYGYK